MIGQAVSAYQKLSMDMIGKLSIESAEIINEVPFFDEGYIFTQMERLKKAHENIARDLKISVELNLQSDYEQKKRENLKFKLDKIELKMSHFALNSFKSLSLCKTLAQGKFIKINGLIDALENYRNGNEALAIKIFKQYFKDNTVASGFFLSNRIYGELLLNAGDTNKALVHLEYAVQLKVDDIKLLMLLQEAYQMMGMNTEREILGEVLRILI